MNNNDFNSELLHVPFDKPDAYDALAMPLYHTAAYEFESAEQMEAAFCGRSAEHAYSRITNPTVQYFEKRVHALQKALSVTALNSGMAAISCTLLTIAKSGTNIITSRHLFGNTFSILNSTLKEFGVEARFCDLTNPEEVKAQIDENTCAIFLEVITNPQLEIVDLTALSAIGKEKNVPIIADTTIVPFCAFKAKDFGIDIEIVSSTKYLSGGGTSLGGLIIDYGTFNWNNSPKLSKVAERFGATAFTNKLRTEIHRNIGAYMTPQAAYMQTLGLETLQLRFEKQASTCLELATRLQKTSGIRSVNYTGLKDNPFYELSLRQFGKYPGAMMTFDLDSREQCFSFLNNLQLIRRATNLFENKSLALHPSSTIYGNFTPEQKKEMNISDCTIRLSVGLESCDDLYNDIVQAVEKATK